MTPQSIELATVPTLTYEIREAQSIDNQDVAYVLDLTNLTEVIAAVAQNAIWAAADRGVAIDNPIQTAALAGAYAVQGMLLRARDLDGVFLTNPFAWHADTRENAEAAADWVEWFVAPETLGSSMALAWGVAPNTGA